MIKLAVSILAVAPGPARSRRSPALRLVSIPVAIVLAAASLKLLDLPAFALHVRSWHLFPDGLVPYVVALVPAAEFALGGMWFLGLGRRIVPFLLIALLFAFSIALAWVAWRRPEATCGCLGWLTRNAPYLDTPKGGLVRNGALMAMLVAGLGWTREAGGGAPKAWS